MIVTSALDRLARRLGIEPAYDDLFGKHHTVPDATRRALLRAMGVAASDETEAAASLAAIEHADATRLLPPVVVHAEDSTAHLRVNLPAEPKVRLHWRIVCEDGATRTGEIAAGALETRAMTTIDARCWRACRLHLPDDLPPGYHRLELEAGDRTASTSLIRTPRSCWTLAEALDDARPFGLTCQVYALASRRNAGIGDLEDLARLAEGAAARGCDFVGVNPLHALFAAEPGHISPYSPSTRLFLNAQAIIALDRLPELADLDIADDPDIAKLRDGPLIDHVAVAARTRPLLERAFARFRADELVPGEEGARGRAFLVFKAEIGEALHRHALFEALHAHMLSTHGAERWTWTSWPEALRHPDGEGVSGFARDHADAIDFHAWLQWLADVQLADAEARAKAAGMRVGIYRDLAIAVNPAGSATWSDPDAMLSDVAVGAPSDLFNPQGQNWGLAPFSPKGLVDAAYRPFIAAVRQNMRHAGALRIDHVMGLLRLFMIPADMSGKDGAYVHYELDDMLGILALESRRHRCLVIGEDLGTVPEGLRPRLARAGVLSCRLFMFERETDGTPSPPESCPEAALVSFSTHDLPTLRGYWQCRDIDWREDIDGEARPRERTERAADRAAILRGLAAAGLLPEGLDPKEPPEELSEALALAVHRLLARARGRLVAIQLEDALFELEQVNLPGTHDEHPNWRRRLRLPVEALFDDPGVQRLLAAVAAERGKGSS